MTETYIILLFNTVREVMKADMVCRAVDLPCVVIPVPERISTRCGMCLRIEANSLRGVKKILVENNIEFFEYE